MCAKVGRKVHCLTNTLLSRWKSSNKYWKNVKGYPPTTRNSDPTPYCWSHWKIPDHIRQPPHLHSFMAIFRDSKQVTVTLAFEVESSFWYWILICFCYCPSRDILKVEDVRGRTGAWEGACWSRKSGLGWGRRMLAGGENFVSEIFFFRFRFEH